LTIAVHDAILVTGKSTKDVEGDAVNVDDVIQIVDDYPGTQEVVVDLGGTYVELTEATYDRTRDALVLTLHPDDTTDALRRVVLDHFKPATRSPR
jgi:hypothetical protein